MSIYDRWYRGEGRKKPRSAEYGCEKRWQVRWRDDQGRQRKQAFAKKSDAERFEATIKAQLVAGTYVDPSAGDVQFQLWAEDWRKIRMHDDATAERLEGMLRRHCYPDPDNPDRTPGGGLPIGGYPIRILAKRPQLLQGWIKGLPLAANSKLLVIGYVSQVFTAAVKQGMITQNPLQGKDSSVQKPGRIKTPALPWTPDQIDAVAAQLPGWLAVAPYIGSGFGVRQGEAFGLAKPDLDFLRKTAHVAVQIKVVGGRLCFAPLKNKTPRDVPMAEPVIPRLSEHLRRFPPFAVSLPWHEPGNPSRHGKLVTRELILTRPGGLPMEREAFNRPWRAAWKAAGIPDRGRANGFHVMRHTFASACLLDGLNPAKVAALIGDTLEVLMSVYAHFLPDDDDRTRDILERFFSTSDGAARAPDVPEAAH